MHSSGGADIARLWTSLITHPHPSPLAKAVKDVQNKLERMVEETKQMRAKFDEEIDSFGKKTETSEKKLEDFLSDHKKTKAAFESDMETLKNEAQQREKKWQDSEEALRGDISKLKDLLKKARAEQAEHTEQRYVCVCVRMGERNVH